ncbi:hypothetical protein L1987_58668 [Smallanthus sonchifolius]|uniref:Uncharacterized protein n=1 Tax=Smallanthus sonchifolius TaxID=185202 RepID=A0ACB9D357_9ASTR|nr:hypothetical protein L1987_58668 [Smallanthus sonchifolius]
MYVCELYGRIYLLFENSKDPNHLFRSNPVSLSPRYDSHGFVTISHDDSWNSSMNATFHLKVVESVLILIP